MKEDGQREALLGIDSGAWEEKEVTCPSLSSREMITGAGPRQYPIELYLEKTIRGNKKEHNSMNRA